jgi:X-linked retinitis pigmentosa GTPase regulator
MPDSRNHHLFRKPSAAEKLDLFQSLLDSKDLTFDQALALLRTIRADLENPKANRSSVYVRYGQLMESLHKQLPEVYEQVANAWRTKRGLLHSEPGTTETVLTSQPREKSLSSEDYAKEPVAGYKQVEEHTRSDQQAVHTTEPQEEAMIEIGGEEEEHGEFEIEEPEEAEAKEGGADEVRKEELEEIEEEKGEENEEEQNEEGEEEKEEQENESEIVEKEEGEEDNAEAKETQVKENEVEANEIAEEPEAEAEEIPDEGEPETESEAESDHMAGEAAEAAAESEHVEIEVEDVEPFSEEEPPMEAEE